MKFKDMSIKELLNAISDILRRLVSDADEQVLEIIEATIKEKQKLTKKDMDNIHETTYNAYREAIKQLADDLRSDDILEYDPNDEIIYEEGPVPSDTVIYDDDIVLPDDRIYVRKEEYMPSIKEVVNEFMIKRKIKGEQKAYDED